jgi:hypothetical protein
MGYIGNGPYQGVLTGGNIQDGTVETTDLADGAVTTAKINDGAVTAGKLAAGAAVPDQTGQSGKFLTTDGTTASWATITVDDEIAIGATAPSSPIQGQVWYDTGLDILKAYDGTNWNKVSPVIPTISSISGTIYEGIGGNITITGTGFLADECSVEFSGSFTTTSVNLTASSDTSLVVAVPSSVYASNGTVTVKVTNVDNGQSQSSTFSVTALPTGGTVTTSGGYRIHTFTSSGTFNNTLSNLEVQYLVIAGGGGGGSDYGGGGGAGGYRCSVSGESSGGGASAENTLILSAGNKTVTVGAGGVGQNVNNGTSGSNSVFASITSIGGGYGSGEDPGTLGASGGSGGGSNYKQSSGGSGTSGQGYAGGGGYTGPYYTAGGGGGAGSPGVNGTPSINGPGGNGVSSSITGSALTRAGGGGAGYSADRNIAGASGGTGGGGNGGTYATADGQSGDTNKGAGGGGAGGSNNSGSYGGNGGSGLVVIRYAL